MLLGHDSVTEVEELMSGESLLRGSSSPLSPLARTRKSRNFRRNTLAALVTSLFILGFLARPVSTKIGVKHSILHPWCVLMLANWILQGKQQDISTEKELRRHHSATHSSHSAKVSPDASVLSSLAVCQSINSFLLHSRMCCTKYSTTHLQ